MNIQPVSQVDATAQIAAVKPADENREAAAKVQEAVQKQDNLYSEQGTKVDYSV
jgi:hypothetical protein